MRTQTVVVNFIDGLTPEKACLLIQKATPFKSEIHIALNDKRVNAKSLLGLISLDIPQNTKVCVQAEGSDEAEAVNAISNFLS